MSDLKHLSTYVITNEGTHTVIDLDAIERKKVAGWGPSGAVNQWWTAYQHEGNSWSFHNDIAPGDKTERRYLQHDESTVGSSVIDSSHPYIPVWDVYPAPGAGRPYFQIFVPGKDPAQIVGLKDSSPAATIEIGPVDWTLSQLWTFTEVYPPSSSS